MVKIKNEFNETESVKNNMQNCGAFRAISIFDLLFMVYTLSQINLRRKIGKPNPHTVVSFFSPLSWRYFGKNTKIRERDDMVS